MTPDREDFAVRTRTTPGAAPVLPPSLSEGIDAYLAWVELEKGRSKNTVLGYENDIHQFARHALSRFGLTAWRCLAGEMVDDWQAELGRQEYTNASAARKMTAIRGFVRYLCAEGLSEGRLADNIKGPKLVRKLPGTLAVEDLDRLLRAPDATSALGLRDRAIMELAYSSGLRVSEICSIRLEFLDLQSGVARVVSGKGAKDRLVPIGRMAVKALERYLTLARPSFVRSRTGSFVFLSQRGQPISRKTVWHLIKTYAGKAGLDARKVKPHILRHSFASHLLAGGADLRVIQEMLGHADIATTQIYTRVDASLAMDQHQKFHPRKRLSGKLSRPAPDKPARTARPPVSTAP